MGKMISVFTFLVHAHDYVWSTGNGALKDRIDACRILHIASNQVSIGAQFDWEKGRVVVPEEKERDSEAVDAASGLRHPVHQVYFRAGLLACREYMARFVEVQSPEIATSIRANWWPRLGEDFGAPRKLDWAELTEGEYGTDSFRCKTKEEVSPTQEALPIALGFLERDLAGETSE